MVVSGETACIRPFCEFNFWDWVKLQDMGGFFLGNVQVHGTYLSPSIDVGAAMTQCIMKTNGEIEDHSTVCSFTPEECMNSALNKEWEKFLESIQERWDQKMTSKDLGHEVLNLVLGQENNEPCEDDDGT